MDAEIYQYVEKCLNKLNFYIFKDDKNDQYFANENRNPSADRNFKEIRVRQEVYNLNLGTVN